ncbi:uncharacterized protein LOC113275569 [Papaver somniferum]|uniref:uncharacterized protein LOC113275569 n=1 Tax=Papaver somniferum TaxID=3469 RepID=UPI000E6F926A|nr:uncharacterized protein LOC113275569 [Papaver somniferum]
MQLRVMGCRYSVLQIASQNAQVVARRHHIKSHACFIVSSVAPNASVYHQEPSGTNRHVHVTTTGRLKKGDLSVLKL